MSKREAGKRFETKIQKYLESLGYKVDKARAGVKFVGPGKFVSSQNDFWGFGDLIAVHHDAGDTLVIQATLDHGIGRKQQRAVEIPWNLNAQRVQIWTVAPVRGWIRVLWLRSWTFWEEHVFRMKTGERPSGNFLGSLEVTHPRQHS